MTDKPTFKRPRSGRADRDALIEWELGDDEVDREEDDDGAEERWKLRRATSGGAR